jgi:hypothetical protein
MKVIRLCVECGKRHDTGIENKITGEFNRIEKCIDCLMSKCSFKFETHQITLDEVKNKTIDEMHTELGETLLDILQRSYGSNEKKEL